MTLLSLQVHAEPCPAPRAFTVRRLICAGYSGRNEAAVRAHIEELAHEGVPPPAQIPLIMPVPARNLSTGAEIEVVSARTSGEAEAVFFVAQKEIYVGVGSDHTDRGLERHDILQSKQVCPKIAGTNVWRLTDLRSRWDELVLRSFVQEGDGPEELYQQGTLSLLRPPEDLLARAGATEGLVLFGGTVPVLKGTMRYAGRFRAELHDPATGRSLSCGYAVRVLAGAVASEK